MGSISSINFKKSTSFQVFHNSSIRPDYAIGGELVYTLKGYEALKLKEKIIAKAMQDYTQHIGQKFKAKSYEWSAVVNLKPESTMQDCENLAKFFEEKYGFQCYQIAIHRDEGHIDERGEKVINHHAHLEFVTLDRKTGKNKYRRELITPSVLRQMQTEVAEILQMERGQDKRLTGVERIEPRQYAQMKEKEKEKTKGLVQEILPQKEVNARIEQERKAWIEEKTHTAEEYKQLRALKERQYDTIQNLETQIKTLNETLKIEKSKTEKIQKENENILQILDKCLRPHNTLGEFNKLSSEEKLLKLIEIKDKDIAQQAENIESKKEIIRKLQNQQKPAEYFRNQSKVFENTQSNTKTMKNDFER